MFFALGLLYDGELYDFVFDWYFEAVGMLYFYFGGLERTDFLPNVGGRSSFDVSKWSSLCMFFYIAPALVSSAYRSLGFL